MSSRAAGHRDPPVDSPPARVASLAAMRAGSAVRALRDRWLDAAGVAGAIGLGLPSLSYPFGVDQSIHWYIGERLLEGELPYVSGISTKPPLTFVVHALAIALFGDHQWSIRVVDLAFVVAIGFVVAALRARPRDPGGPPLPDVARPGEVGVACVAVSGIYYGFFDFHHTAHPDLWEGFFLLSAACVVVRAPGGRVSVRRAFAAGALAGVAAMLKQSGAVPGFVLGASIVVHALTRGARADAWRNALAFTAGVALVLAIVVLPFVLGGHFDAFREVMIDFIFEYAEKSFEKKVSAFPPWLYRMEYGLGAVIACVGAVIAGLGIAEAARDARARRFGLLVLGAMVVAFLSVLIQRRGHSYYNAVAVPVLALGLAWGLRRIVVSPARQLVIVLSLLALAMVAQDRAGAPHRYLSEWESWIGFVRGERSFAEHHVSRYRHRDNIVAVHAVARSIRARARPGDTLCVDGRLVVLYQLTGMRCPSRIFVTDGILREMPQLAGELDDVLAHDGPTFFATYADRRRVRQLERLGYTTRSLRVGPRRSYAIMERAAGRSGAQPSSGSR